MRPVVTNVSTATRLLGSSVSSASRIVSLIWSAILSGCPSVTDSEVNRRPVTAPRYPPVETAVSGRLPPGPDPVPDDVRESRLRPARHGGRGAVALEHHRLVVGTPEDLACADVVDHEQVTPLPGQLGGSVLQHRSGLVAGLRGETDHHQTRLWPVVGQL